VLRLDAAEPGTIRGEPLAPAGAAQQ
jgi:hypothetical protein